MAEFTKKFPDGHILSYTGTSQPSESQWVNAYKLNFGTDSKVPVPEETKRGLLKAVSETVGKTALKTGEALVSPVTAAVKGVQEASGIMSKPFTSGDYPEARATARILGGLGESVWKASLLPLSVPATAAYTAATTAFPGIKTTLGKLAQGAMKLPIPTYSGQYAGYAPQESAQPTIGEVMQGAQRVGERHPRTMEGISNLANIGMAVPYGKLGMLPVAAAKFIGTPVEKAGRGLIEAAKTAVPAKLQTAAVQLFEKAPADIKAKLGGSTYADKLEVLTKNIKQYGLDKYATNGPKLEEVTHDLAHQAIKKADAELLEKNLGITPSAIQPAARPGSVYEYEINATKINPWQVAEKAVNDQIALKSKGAFPTEDIGRYSNVMNKLKGTWGKEWNEPKNVKDVLEFKRKVLNKKGDIFKKIDEINPAEKPEVTIKKEMYFAINNALEKLPGGENFAKYNKQARDLMQIRDIATHMKRTPITSGLAGTLIGGGLGAAAGQLANLSRTTAPLAPALSMLGGAAGAAIGKKLPAFSLKSSRPYVKEDIGRALVGYGNLIQMKRMNIPPTIIKAYRKSLADMIDPDVVSAVEYAASEGLKKGVAESHPDFKSALFGLDIPQTGRKPGPIKLVSSIITKPGGKTIAITRSRIKL